MLGVAAARSGDLDSALTCLARAIDLGGARAEWCANLGEVLLRLGRSDQAASCFRQALAENPLNAQLAFNLGSALVSSGRPAVAVPAFEHSVELDPINPAFWFALAFALYRSGDAERATECYGRVLKLNPKHAETLFNLGVIRMSQSRLAEATRFFERALALNPQHPEALNNLGLLQQIEGDNQAAASSFRRACRVRTGYYEAEFNLARALSAQQDIEGALEAYRKSVERCPEHVDARVGLAMSLVELGRPQEAVPHLEAAIECDPESIPAKLNLAITLLQLGRWEEGWRLYESRLRRNSRAHRQFETPQWNGEQVAGRRILIYAEQGLGDTVQFSRYVQLVRDLGATVVVECQPSLAGLLQTLDGVDEIILSGDRLPAFDLHAPLLSLPRRFATQPNTVPADVPYLLADRERSDEWSTMLRRDIDPGLIRVGLTWAGNPAHQNDRNRSFDPSILKPVAEVEGVAFFNLQKTAQREAGLPLYAMAQQCADFADTAAAILNLDLVISVDTAVAHLAGALGKPVWTLLPFAADWRWMLDRSDTPWYPTMRLFRQPKRGDWASVIRSVQSELEQIVGMHRT